MTKVKTFDHIFQEVEFGYNLDTINLNAINNSTLNEVNFWRKIVEFYYKVFRDLLNTLFRRNGNMKRFFTFFVKLSKISSTNYFMKQRISWNFSSAVIHFLFLYACLSR